MGMWKRIIKTELERESRAVWRGAKALAADRDIWRGVVETPRLDGFKSSQTYPGRKLIVFLCVYYL